MFSCYCRCAALGVSFASQMFVWNVVQMQQEYHWSPSPWSWISLPAVASLLLAATALRHVYSITFEKEILWPAASLRPTWALATGSVLCTRFFPIVATSLRWTETATVYGVFATSVLNARAAHAAKERLEQRLGDNEDDTGEKDFIKSAITFAFGLTFIFPTRMLTLFKYACSPSADERGNSARRGEQQQPNLERSVEVCRRYVYIIGSMIYLAHNPPGLLVISSLLLSPSSRVGYELAADTCLLGMIIQIILSRARWLIVICWMSPRTTLAVLCLLRLGFCLLRSCKDRSARLSRAMPHHGLQCAVVVWRRDGHAPSRRGLECSPCWDYQMTSLEYIQVVSTRTVALPHSRSSDNFDAESGWSWSKLLVEAFSESAIVELVNTLSSDELCKSASRLQKLQAVAQDSGVRWPETLASLVDDLRQHGLLQNSENILHGVPAVRLAKELWMLDAALQVLAEVVEHKIRHGAIDECGESFLYKQRIEEAKSCLDHVAKAKGGWLPGFLGGWQTDRTTVDSLYSWE
ncbi:unnamed protein product, partial [Scytosiphon promiscuus]